jgi:hypothetical protein
MRSQFAHANAVTGGGIIRLSRDEDVEEGLHLPEGLIMRPLSAPMLIIRLIASILDSSNVEFDCAAVRSGWSSAAVAAVLDRCPYAFSE